MSATDDSGRYIRDVRRDEILVRLHGLCLYAGALWPNQTVLSRGLALHHFSVSRVVLRLEKEGRIRFVMRHDRRKMPVPVTSEERQ
jgi:hypothetical protein